MLLILSNSSAQNLKAKTSSHKHLTCLWLLSLIKQNKLTLEDYEQESYRGNSLLYELVVTIFGGILLQLQSTTFLLFLQY